jgi:lipid II:glycine glycyltransferase (peptidoglycan interpeptide bridge formation enzyme)
MANFSYTLLVDLEKEDLLSSFDKDTRYCIRRAKRENVRMQVSEDINSFYNLLEKASQRHNFNIYSKEYFTKFLSIPFVKLLVANYKSQPIAAALVSYFGNRVTYLHAGSDYEKRKLNAPSLVNYKAMQIGIENGFKEYDMWGIDKDKMPGVTKFKKGFQGEELVYPPAKDLLIKEKKYWLYEKAYKYLK